MELFDLILFWLTFAPAAALALTVQLDSKAQLIPFTKITKIQSLFRIFQNSHLEV